jgi:hypothetical protein
MDIAGVIHTIYTSTAGTIYGLDTNNFTPITIRSVIVTLPSDAELTEWIILKVIETKDSHSPAQPLQVEAEQQIVADEVMSYGGTGVNPQFLLDKNALTAATLAVGAGTITINLSHPIMVAHVALMGILDVVTVTVNRIDGTTITVISETGASDTSQWSGNFEPTWINSITITQGAGAAVGSTLFELAVMKVIETKSYSLAPEVGLLEFYGQRISYDRLAVYAGGEVYEYENYLLLRRALETDADNDPTVNNDSTVATITNDAVDAERIKVRFYVPTDDIRSVRHHVTALATVECGANARCTTMRYRICKVNLTTSTLTGLSAVKTVTFPALSFDGATSRAVRAIMQDLYAQDIAEHEVLVLEIAVWGRQVSANVVPSFITLWHRRGLGDCKLDVECVTNPSPPSPP